MTKASRAKQADESEGEGRPDSVSVPLRMPRELKDRVTSVAEEVKLKEQDVMRLGLERGLDVLLSQLRSAPVQP